MAAGEHPVGMRPKGFTPGRRSGKTAGKHKIAKEKLSFCETKKYSICIVFAMNKYENYPKIVASGHIRRFFCAKNKTEMGTHIPKTKQIFQNCNEFLSQRIFVGLAMPKKVVYNGDQIPESAILWW